MCLSVEYIFTFKKHDLTIMTVFPQTTFIIKILNRTNETTKNDKFAILIEMSILYSFIFDRHIT